MGRVQLSPGGKLTIATLKGDAGAPYVCVEFEDWNTGADYGLHFDMADFVTIADHLKSVADELVGGLG